MRAILKIFKNKDNNIFYIIPYAKISDSFGSGQIGECFIVEYENKLSFIDLLKKAIEAIRNKPNILDKDSHDVFKEKFNISSNYVFDNFESISIDYIDELFISPLDKDITMEAGYYFTSIRKSGIMYMGSPDQIYLPLTATPEQIGQAVLDAFVKCEELNKNRK